MQIHQPKRCTTCGEQFLGTRALTAYRRSDNPKPFECDQCGRTFARLNNLTRHQTAKHRAPPIQSGGGAAAAALVDDPPNWRAMADLIQYTSLPEAEQSPLPIYQQKWAQIRTHFRRNNRLHDWYNFRLRDLQPATMATHLNDIFRDQRTVFKLNLSFGFLLRNQETGDLRDLAFPEPFVIAREADLQQVREALNNLDVLEWARQQRDNSKWVVEQITNVTFYVNKQRGHPIGCGRELPPYLKYNRRLQGLVWNRHGTLYQDMNLCIFRALALSNGCILQNLEKAAKDTVETYRAAHLTDENLQTFKGVQLDDVSDLERLFKKNIFVYALGPVQVDQDEEAEDEEDEHTAKLIYRSLGQYEGTVYLNLYENHFSYIYDISKYSHSYQCAR